MRERGWLGIKVCVWAIFLCNLAVVDWVNYCVGLYFGKSVRGSFFLFELE